MFWKKKPKKPENTREMLIKQASNVVQNKREEIGSDTLDVIRDALMRKENSVMTKAKRNIIDANEDKVRDHLKYMMHDKT